MSALLKLLPTVNDHNLDFYPLDEVLKLKQLTKDFQVDRDPGSSSYRLFPIDKNEILVRFDNLADIDFAYDVENDCV